MLGCKLSYLAEMKVKLTLEAIKHELSLVRGNKHGVDSMVQVSKAVLALQKLRLVKISKGRLTPDSTLHVVEDAVKLIPLLCNQLRTLQSASCSDPQ